jgi:hypothetical protein
MKEIKFGSFLRIFFYIILWCHGGNHCLEYKKTTLGKIIIFGEHGCLFSISAATREKSA